MQRQLQRRLRALELRASERAKRPPRALSELLPSWLMKEWERQRGPLDSAGRIDGESGGVSTSAVERPDAPGIPASEQPAQAD